MSEYVELGEIISVLKQRYDRLSRLRPDFYAGYMAAVEIIEQETRNADVAPVVNGHWEHIAYDKYRCSVCKMETTVDTWLGEPLYKGCPYCFAIMDEKDGETDGKKL